MLIKQHKLRINVRLDGKLVQQSRAEAVDGRDNRAFEGSLVTQPCLPFRTRRLLQQAIDSRPNALPHFVRRTIRKSDGDDVVDRYFSSAQDFKVSLNQDEGFPGARSGGHRQVTVKRVRGDFL